MLLIVLALFWVALLAPIAIRRLRDGGTDKSIRSFHAEHEVLSRQDYAIVPAHRLDQPDQVAPQDQLSQRRPRLTVVHADDTYGTLEARSSWDEWADDYEYDDSARPPSTAPNRYAKAYSSRPSEPVETTRYEAPIRRRTMRSQRRMMFTRLVLAAVILSAVAFFSGSSLLYDVAALSLLAVVTYVALAFYSVSQGYLNDDSLPIRVPQRRQLATIDTLYAPEYDEYAPRYEEEFESEFYEPTPGDRWGRPPRRTRALG